MARARWKTCQKCKKNLPLADFYTDKSRVDGLTYRCRVCILEASRVYNSNNKERVNLRSKEYRLNNIAKVRNSRAARARIRYSTDPVFRLNRTMSVRMAEFLRERSSGKGGQSWKDLTGYNLDELRASLEAKFQPGMTWDNYGEWHVDHIKPLALFSANDHKEAWSLDNLQPLWAEGNIRKKDIYEPT